MKIASCHFEMSKFSVVFLHLAVVALSFWSVECLSEEEKSAIKESLKPIGMVCNEECGLDSDAMKSYKEGDDMDPCFKKCFMKKVGLLDGNGKYNRDAIVDSMAEYSDKVEEAKKMQEKMDSCFDENGDNDGDDEESEMKRVEVIFNCMKEMKE